ncbi:MAG: hypothetical protein AAF329_09800 [Cyanobacteria bacterium P01_A01_bin.17]
MLKSKLKKPVATACSLVGGSIVLASVSIVAVLSIQKPGCACGDPASSAVGAAIYERIEQHMEQGQFLESTLETLPGREKRYRYLTQVQDDIAYTYAIPKQAYFQAEWGPFKGKRQYIFRGAVSAVTFNEEKQTYAKIVCISREASDLTPPTPVFNGQFFTCPQGMDERQ